MKKLLGLAFAVLLLASCSSEDENQLQSGSKEIRFSSELSLLKSSYQGSQIANGQKVGIFVAEDSASPITTYEQNLAYTGDGQGNLAGTTLYFPNNGNSIKVSAYHPYNAGTEDTYQFTVATDQTQTASIYASDLLYCPTFVQAPISGQVTLKFKHLLSQVNVSLTAGNGTPDLTGAQVSIENAATSIYFNRKNGDLGTALGINSVALSQGSAGITVPQTIASGTKFIRVVLSSGKELFYTLNQNLTLQSGKKYTFNLQINLTDVANVGTEIDEWETGEIINGGAGEELAEKLLPKTITEEKFRQMAKIDFTYDALNRVEKMIMEISGTDPLLISIERYEYEFKYSGSDSQIIGFDEKVYDGSTLITPVLRDISEVDFIYGSGSVDLQYVSSAVNPDDGSINEYDRGVESVSFTADRDAVWKESVTAEIDDKLTPFEHINMDGWLRSYLLVSPYALEGRALAAPLYSGKHNPIRIYSNGSTLYRNFTLTYNAKGYLLTSDAGKVEGNGRPVHKRTVEYTAWK